MAICVQFLGYNSAFLLILQDFEIFGDNSSFNDFSDFNDFCDFEILRVYSGLTIFQV